MSIMSFRISLFVSATPTMTLFHETNPAKFKTVYQHVVHFGFSQASFQFTNRFSNLRATQPLCSQLSVFHCSNGTAALVQRPDFINSLCKSIIWHYQSIICGQNRFSCSAQNALLWPIKHWLILISISCHLLCWTHLSERFTWCTHTDISISAH